jgi:hypothetical protein
VWPQKFIVPGVVGTIPLERFIRNGMVRSSLPVEILLQSDSVTFMFYIRPELVSVRELP